MFGNFQANTSMESLAIASDGGQVLVFPGSILLWRRNTEAGARDMCLSKQALCRAFYLEALGCRSLMERQPESER